MGILNRRSPISPKALNWRELVRLKLGTKLIFFQWSKGNRKTEVTLISTYRTWSFGDPTEEKSGRVVLLHAGGQDIDYASDLGVESYGGRRWHDSHALVLPEYAHTLPTKPHWSVKFRE